MREIISPCVDLLNRCGEQFWNFASVMFVQVTVLVLVLLALELLLRNRVRAVVRFSVWLLVLVKLVLPVGLHTPASVAYWLPTSLAADSWPSDRVLGNNASGSEIPRHVPTEDGLGRLDSALPRATVAADENALVADRQTSAAPSSAAPAAVVAAPPSRLHWQGALFGTWLLAIALLLAMVVRRALWVRRIVHDATDAPRELHDQLRECLAAQGMTMCRVDLKISDRLGSPAICGLWRPTILLPRGFPAGLDREQIRLVFVHELVHWRRGDLQVNCCQTLLQILYFYNPAVWLANLIIRRLREQAVDETVLVALRGETERYAATLLDIASAALQPAEAMLRLIGVVESRRALSMRIRHILRRPIPRTAKLGITGLAAIAAAGVLLLPMGQRERSAVAKDEPIAKSKEASDKQESDLNDAPKAEPAAAAKGQDIDGDPLPAGTVARLGTKRFRSARRPAALTYLPDGKTLLQITDDGWLQHWDSASGRLLSETRFSSERQNRNEPAALGGGLVAVHGSHVDEVKRELINWLGVFDQITGKRLMEMPTVDRRIKWLALSPDGRILAYCGSLDTTGEQVRLIDVASHTEIVSRKIAAREVASLAFSADGQILAIGGPGGLLLWKWAGKEEPRSIAIPFDPRKSPHSVDVVAFSPDGTVLAVGSSQYDSPGVLLIDTRSGRIVHTLGVPGVEHWFFRTLVFSPDGKTLASPIEKNSGGGVALWEVVSGKLIRRVRGMFGEAYFLAFSSDGRQLSASSGWESTMYVWNLESGEPVGAGPAGHLKPPNSIRFLPGDQQLVTTGDDGTIRIWNVTDSRQERVLGHEWDERTFDCGVRGMDVSPDGKYIVSSSFDDTVRLWEIATGREVYRLPGHGWIGGTRALKFTPDSKHFASWGDDMRVYLWDVATGKALQEFVARPAGLRFESDEMGNPPFSGAAAGPQLDGGCFSADASTLIVLLNGARRFSVQSGEELPKIDLQDGLGSQLAISPDDRHMLLANWSRGRTIPLKSGGAGSYRIGKSHPVELRSLPDGKLITKLDLDGTGAGPIAFSPDGGIAAMTLVGSPQDVQQIEICKVPELLEMARIDLPSRAWAVEFSHSGKLLAASMSDSTVLVWDLDHLPQKKNP